MDLQTDTDTPLDKESYAIQKRNFRNVQIDAIGVGLASSSAIYLPVFLTRLGASATQIGLLTTMPGVTGLLLSILVGRFLQTRRKIVPWFSAARLTVLSAYAATGLVPFLVPDKYIIPAVLVIWAIVTLPQTMVAIAFSVVMNAVAGPQRRYDLMSRRWSLLGLTSAVSVAFTGQILDRINFPINYQAVFLALSVGGLISYYFSSHIQLPDVEQPPRLKGGSARQALQEYIRLVKGEPAFISFALRRFVFLFGTTLAVPIFPLYYVREVQASDAWIGFIVTSQTVIMLVGYYIWSRQSRMKGSHFVLSWTTLGVALFPALVASTDRVELIAFFAALAGIFQAGVDLVFFDELMKTVPIKYSATFVSLAQSMQYLSTIISPLAGTIIADLVSLKAALLVSAAVRLLGFALFAFTGQVKPVPADHPEPYEV